MYITFVIWTNKCCYLSLVHWFTANYKLYTICALFKTTYLWLHTTVGSKKCRVPAGHLVIGATGLSGVLHVSLNSTSLTCKAVWNDTIHHRVAETIWMCSDGVSLEAQNDTWEEKFKQKSSIKTAWCWQKKQRKYIVWLFMGFLTKNDKIKPD